MRFVNSSYILPLFFTKSELAILDPIPKHHHSE